MSNGRVRGDGRFGVGALSHLLKNRFYIGDVVYGGGVHRGEHEPILDRAVFDAVQSTLAANAVVRQVRLKGSPAILAGRIFDDRGNRMSPTHTNKRGVRYRYYISQAHLQKRSDEVGAVSRVPAPEVESLVVEALSAHLRALDPSEVPTRNDRELIDRLVERIDVKTNQIDIRLIDLTNLLNGAVNQEIGTENLEHVARRPAKISLPWTAPSFAAIKGIVHAPGQTTTMKPEARHALLTAIAKARLWIDELVQGRTASYEEIAKREGKSSGTFGCSHRSRSYRRRSLQRSWTVLHLRTLL